MKCANISKPVWQARLQFARLPENGLAEMSEIDTVFVLALRGQREAGYTQN